MLDISSPIKLDLCAFLCPNERIRQSRRTEIETADLSRLKFLLMASEADEYHCRGVQYQTLSKKKKEEKKKVQGSYHYDWFRREFVKKQMYTSRISGAIRFANTGDRNEIPISFNFLLVFVALISLLCSICFFRNSVKCAFIMIINPQLGRNVGLFHSQEHLLDTTISR